VQFGVAAVVGASVAVIVPPVAGILLGPEFQNSSAFVGWFVVGFLFNAMYYMVTNYIFFAERTAWLAAVTMSVAILNIPLTYLLISLNGAVGAAQAMAASYGLAFILTWVVSQRAFPMPWLAAIRHADRR
jgi:Na+-driven multidrug efflux pump